MSFAGRKKGAFSFGSSSASGAGAASPLKAAHAGGKGKQRAIDSASRTPDDEDDDVDDDEDEEFDDGGDDDYDEDDDDDDDFGDTQAEEDGDEEADTDDEIEAAKAANAKSSQTAKRKRRATSPGAFGATLQSLLGAGPDADADADAAGPDTDDEGADDDSAGLAPLPKRQKSTRTAVAAATGPPASLTTQTTGTFLASSRPSAILSLAPHLRRTLTSQKLNAKAARLAMQQRKMREERAHVTDVIGGWGPPGVLPTVDETAWNTVLAKKKQGVAGFGKNLLGGTVNVDEADEEQRAWLEEGGSRAYERKLRKVAQRGVVKLFNAIRAAQTTSLDDVKVAAAADSKADESTVIAKKTVQQGGKDAALTNLSKANFLDLIRSGTGSGRKES